MSLYGMMRTGVSGMNAQVNRLSTVADNVANVNTTGYKSSSCEFSSLLLSTWGASYESGSVLTKVRNQIDAQGALTNTTSSTDLAISGEGFFVVANAAGTPCLTRAGSFLPNGEGTLVNAAGFTLLGYKLYPVQPDLTVNGFTNLAPVNLETLSLTASPSTEGAIKANLPASASTVAAANLPSANGASASYTAKSSLLTYDSLGGEVKLDIYFAKTAANSWEVSLFDARDAAAGGGFPYSSAALASQTVAFGADGKPAAAAPGALSLTIPGGAAFDFDISGLTQFAAKYQVLSASANGTPAGQPQNVEFARDGHIYALYDSGTRIPVFRIPLANVTSPNQLQPQAGNVFTATDDSGDVTLGFPREAGLGDIVSSTLEQSTVDLAGELTSMIDAQRSYTANSKVFQTGAELMDVLVNLKR